MFYYYQELGYFNTNNEYRFIIDKYNMLKAGQTLSDNHSLIGSAIFESSITNCNDIPAIFASENTKNNIVGNNNDASYLNFFVAFQPSTEEQANKTFFEKYGFNNSYSMPYHMLYTLIVSLPTTNIDGRFFCTITQTEQNLYNITWSNKQNKILNSQTIFVNFDFSNIIFQFLTTDKNWTGATLHKYNLNNNIRKINELKIVYSQLNNQHTLQATYASPIDKINFIHTIEFTQYPITELYYDLYKTFQVLPYIRCNIFQHGDLPDFLQNLSTTDWQNGIYLIPNIENNDLLSEKNPGTFTVTFYKSDGKTILGSTSTTQGLLNNTTQSQFIEPIKIYNLYSAQFNPVIQAFLTSGILLKYNFK